MTVSWFTPLFLSLCARKANWNCYQDEERKGVLAEIGLGKDCSPRKTTRDLKAEEMKQTL
jgi:predicted Fe-S protein YdhL (DUF1289 family)